MIEHYALHEIKNLTDRYGLTDGLPKGVKPRYNISPVQDGPVIVQSGNVRELRMMKWGLVPQGAKDSNSVFRYKTFNTKSEKAFSKPAWDTAVRRQRCIIPLNGFYMKRNDAVSKDTYYFTSSEQTLLGVAGMYTTWTDPSGAEAHTYTMLTIDANEAIRLPFKRMPVLLHAEDEARWLDADIEDFSTLVSIMRPYEGSPLVHHKVSSDVNLAKNDTAHLIESV